MSNDVSLETKAYPECYMSRHKFSLLVVGLTRYGKTFFFEKISYNGSYSLREQEIEENMVGTTVSGRMDTK